MLKQNATACAAVKQFVDKFDKLKNDQAQLEVGEEVKGRGKGWGRGRGSGDGVEQLIVGRL